MRHLIVQIAVIWLLLLVGTAPCLPEQVQKAVKTISEAAVKQASAKQYSDILIRACRNGWRYPRSKIDNGFKRHLEELILQLIENGYVIVPDEKSAPATDVRVFQNKKLCRYGCEAPYWIEKSE
jgi:hypothetical protein